MSERAEKVASEVLLNCSRGAVAAAIDKALDETIEACAKTAEAQCHACGDGFCSVCKAAEAIRALKGAK